MATTPLATWNVRLEPSKKTTVRLTSHADLKITNAALDAILADENGRSTVMIEIQNAPLDSDDDSEDETGSPSLAQNFVLTNLVPRTVESSIHDTIITRPAEITFEVIGKNTIHLSGYYYAPADLYSDDEDEYDEDEDEYSDQEGDGILLGDVASDVEYMADQIELEGDSDTEMPNDSHRFEEVVDEPAEVGKKRPRGSEEADIAQIPEAGQKLSKKAQKKLKALQSAGKESKADSSGSHAGPKDTEGPPQKKAKNANGAAVPVEKNKKENKPAEKGANPAVAAANSEGAQAKKQKEKDTGKGKEKAPDAQVNKKGEAGKPKQLAGGLVITDKKVGTGAVAKKGSKVQVRYIGKLANGTIFDQNTSGQPFRFKVGSGEVIKGWDEGFAGMKEGGERTIVVPPKMGYGAKQSGPIPANATLTFDVKLLGVS
ncbi:peptidylprolyl isomerase fpr4 [Serendipita sp. 396]|nr:peptidylprolyl isomerase fpr4 [Serendipita sp. 396]KAG8788114.1 peptidylprolyl isomerase fpr4 [Serendipita sp. 397]KAG8824066.1 peptidylprolyl isomerase fpr4 [Serendipita sp. 401]KAG9055519.1 peptidylprolyl isomerase fpr4 [Serendipita sp. 407]